MHLAVIGVGVATTLGTTIGSSVDQEAPMVAAVDVKMLNPAGEDPGKHDSTWSFSQALEQELRDLRHQLAGTTKELEDAEQDLAAQIRRSLYQDDDHEMLWRFGKNQAMCHLALQLLEHGFSLYETSAEGVPNMDTPSSEGVEAWRHVRKRLRKRKFSLP